MANTIMKQAYQIKGTPNAKQITFHYEPIADTLVIIIMERLVNSKKARNWVVQQIAGPWGNTSIENGLNGMRVNELTAAQDEARNLTRYLEGDEGFTDYWKATVI